MKLVHFSDSHLGVTTHGKDDPTTGLNSRVSDFFASLCQVVDYIDFHKPDMVLFSGDAFHKPTPTPTYINLFGEIVEGITAVCPMIIIPGNHDQTANPRDSAVSVYQPYSNCYCNDNVVNHMVETRAGLVTVDAYPYSRKYLYDGIQNDEDVIRGWLTANNPVANIMVGHFSIQGCIYGYEKELWLSMDAPITLKHISKEYDYVAMGHIHLRQQIGKRHIYYAGSTDRIDFGEETETKGFNVVEIVNGQTQVEFVPIVNRNMQTFRYDMTGVKRNHTATLLSLLEQDAVDPDNSIARIIVDVEDYCLDVQHIHNSTNFHNLVSVAQIPHKHQRVQRLDDVTSMNEYELLDAYFHGAGYEDGEIDTMLDLFEEVMANEQRN